MPSLRTWKSPEPHRKERIKVVGTQIREQCNFKFLEERETLAADSWVKVSYLRHFELCVAQKVLVMGGGKCDLVGTVDELLNFSDTDVR